MARCRKECGLFYAHPGHRSAKVGGGAVSTEVGAQTGARDLASATGCTVGKDLLSAGTGIVWIVSSWRLKLIQRGNDAPHGRTIMTATPSKAPPTGPATITEHEMHEVERAN